MPFVVNGVRRHFRLRIEMSPDMSILIHPHEAGRVEVEFNSKPIEHGSNSNDIVNITPVSAQIQQANPKNIHHSADKTKIVDFINTMQHEMSTRLYQRLRHSDKIYLDDLDEKTFLGMRNVGMKTYEYFLSVKERYYRKINKEQDKTVLQ